MSLRAKRQLQPDFRSFEEARMPALRADAGSDQEDFAILAGYRERSCEDQLPVWIDLALKQLRKHFELLTAQAAPRKRGKAR
jgi:hypothetical protein